MANALVQVRINEEIKDRATAIYDTFGIDLSTAIKKKKKRSVMVNGIPFSMILQDSFDKAQNAATALKKLSNAAKENGTSEMSLEEINAEIEAVRRDK